MAAEWFQGLISDYERQITNPLEVPRPMQIVIGPDDKTTWEAADKLWFVSEYKLPLTPTRGKITGCRGQSISYGLPAALEDEWAVNIHDYDVELRDQLVTYAHGNTALRIWGWGIFVASGYVADVPIQMPLDTVLPVKFVLTGLRYIKASAHDQVVTDFDLSSQVSLLQMPFALDVASYAVYALHTLLYGTEIMV
jgi:hypothetical protein